MKLGRVACGEMFTVVLDTAGKLYTCGLAEFGQLGNGENGEYFVTASKLAYRNSSKFQRRTKFVKKTDRDKPEAVGLEIPNGENIRFASVACGKNHAVVIEAERGERAKRSEAKRASLDEDENTRDETTPATPANWLQT